MRARLSRHVLSPGNGRERPGRAHRRRSGPPFHRRLRLRQGQPRHGTRPFARAHRDAAAPGRPQGRGPLCALRLGRGARRDRRALARDHRPVWPAGASRLRLQRASGADQPRPRQRAVPCAGREPAARRHGLRHLLRDRLGHDRRAGRRRRSRSRRPRPISSSPGAPISSRPTFISGRSSKGSASKALRSSSSTRARAAPRGRRISTCRSGSAPTQRWPWASCTSWRATGSATATTSPATRSVSTGWRPKSCRVSRPSASPRSPACRSPTSSASPPFTAAPRPPSSGSARA